MPQGSTESSRAERDRFAGASTAEFHGCEGCEGTVSSYASAVLAISRSPRGETMFRPFPMPCPSNRTRELLLGQLESCEISGDGGISAQDGKG